MIVSNIYASTNRGAAPMEILLDITMKLSH
jgi:hypothetical protein